jgi:hypothetical protein
MIRRTDKIHIRVKNGRETKTHTVVLTITGRRSLVAFADAVFKAGNGNLALRIRWAKRFSINLTPEQADALKL